MTQRSSRNGGYYFVQGFLRSYLYLYCLTTQLTFDVVTKIVSVWEHLAFPLLVVS